MPFSRDICFAVKSPLRARALDRSAHFGHVSTLWTHQRLQKGPFAKGATYILKLCPTFG